MVIYLYINIYSTFLHQQNWSNTSRRKSFTVFVLACLFFTKQKTKNDVFPGVVVSNMFYFHPEYILGEDEPILTCAYFSKGVFLHFDEGHTLFFFPSSQLVSRRLPIHQPSFEFQDLAMLTPCTWSCCTGVSEFIGHGEKEVPKLEKMVWVARHVEKRCIYIYMCWFGRSYFFC